MGWSIQSRGYHGVGRQVAAVVKPPYERPGTTRCARSSQVSLTRNLVTARAPRPRPRCSPPGPGPCSREQVATRARRHIGWQGRTSFLFQQPPSAHAKAAGRSEHGFHQAHRALDRPACIANSSSSTPCNARRPPPAASLSLVSFDRFVAASARQQHRRPPSVPWGVAGALAGAVAGRSSETRHPSTWHPAARLAKCITRALHMRPQVSVG